MAESPRNKFAKPFMAFPAIAEIKREWRCRFLMAKHLEMFLPCFRGHHGWLTRDPPSWRLLHGVLVAIRWHKEDLRIFQSPHFPFFVLWNIPSRPRNVSQQNNTVGWPAKQVRSFGKLSQYQYLWTDDNSINVCPRANRHFLNLRYCGIGKGLATGQFSY